MVMLSQSERALSWIGEAKGSRTGRGVDRSRGRRFADVEYRDITSEDLLRQSSFKGLKRK
jgi:hypothetical protein